MGGSKKVVAVLLTNPALSSILCMVLASAPSLRIRPFESLNGLLTYLRLAPADVVVVDFDSDTARADLVAATLHADPRLENRDFQLIALSSTVTRETKDASISAGIDEIILKPMSPKYLLERVLARIRRREAAARLRKHAVSANVTRLPVPLPSNVVPLFGPRFEPRA